MPVTISAAEIARASGILSPYTKDRLKPILSCVRLDATKDRVTLSATNLAVSATAILRNCDVVAPEQTALRADKLFRFAAGYPKSAITISPNGTKAAIASDLAKLSIPTESVQDFPVRLQPNRDPITLQAAAIVSASRVAFAADAGGSARYAMEGVALISHQGWLYMSGCNEHILAIHRVAEIGRDVTAIMPPAAIPLLRTLDGDCEVAFADNAIGFKTDAVECAIALFEWRYPRIFDIAMRSHAGKATIDREALIQAARSAALVTTEERESCSLTISDGSLQVSGNTEEGEFGSAVPCVTEGAGEIAVKAKYLIDAASSFPAGAPITLRIGDNCAMRLESEELDYYVHLMGLMK